MAEGGHDNEAVKGGWSYIIAPLGLRAGDVVVSYRSGIPEKLIQQCDMTSSMYGSTLPSGETDAVSPPRKSRATDTPEMRRALGMLRTVTLKPGNVLPLYLIPPGMQVHNISLTVDGRMQLCRSAGTFGQVVSHQGSDGRSIGGSDVLTMGGGFDEEGNRVPKKGFVLVKLQSGEVRKLDPGCVATIGVVSKYVHASSLFQKDPTDSSFFFFFSFYCSKEHQFRQLGKAGRNRWLGRRPHVRGAAMNSVDHAHGGGRGKSKGNKHPRSIYGTLQHVRTRRPKDKDGNKAYVYSCLDLTTVNRDANFFRIAVLLPSDQEESRQRPSTRPSFFFSFRMHCYLSLDTWTWLPFTGHMDLAFTNERAMEDLS